MIGQPRVVLGLAAVAVAFAAADTYVVVLALPDMMAGVGVSPEELFELSYFGESGLLRATARGLALEPTGGSRQDLPLPPQAASVDADFAAALAGGGAPCCPAEEALDTVRLLEAIGRSAAAGQVVHLA